MKNSGINPATITNPKMRAQIDEQLATVAKPRMTLAEVFGLKPSPQPEAGKKRLRQQSGDGMNKTERAFLDYLMHHQTGNNLLLRISSQDITLRIANGCRYTPDFCLHYEQGGEPVSFYEVKGFMRDDAAVKIKVAARQFPGFYFYLVTKRKGPRTAPGCQWDIQRITP